MNYRKIRFLSARDVKSSLFMKEAIDVVEKTFLQLSMGKATVTQRTIMEISGEIILRAKTVIDHRESCLAEAGDLIIPMEERLIDENHICAEIGEIIAGQKPGRENSEEVTFSNQLGTLFRILQHRVKLLKMPKI